MTPGSRGQCEVQLSHGLHGDIVFVERVGVRTINGEKPGSELVSAETACSRPCSFFHEKYRPGDPTTTAYRMWRARFIATTMAT
ncbi:hypothetical protein M0R45_032777 [Rubus argutus]|uniref:Uncharacterized protein n=1 Tax=Rubus argutus TaxID=59490 RepID=A0AAW1WHL4_RUBAR